MTTWSRYFHVCDRVPMMRHSIFALLSGAIIAIGAPQRVLAGADREDQPVSCSVYPVSVSTRSPITVVAKDIVPNPSLHVAFKVDPPCSLQINTYLADTLTLNSGVVLNVSNPLFWTIYARDFSKGGIRVEKKIIQGNYKIVSPIKYYTMKNKLLSIAFASKSMKEFVYIYRVIFDGSRLIKRKAIFRTTDEVVSVNEFDAYHGPAGSYYIITRKGDVAQANIVDWKH